MDGSKVGGFVSTWQGTSVLVLHNPSRSTKTVDLAQFGAFTALRAVIGVGSAQLNGSLLTLEGQTSVVMGQ